MSPAGKKDKNPDHRKKGQVARLSKDKTSRMAGSKTLRKSSGRAPSGGGDGNSKRAAHDDGTQQSVLPAQGSAERASFPIVGIGASAGGLEALAQFFEAMPSDSGMAFIVVVHLAPSHVSILPELVQKHTGMVVEQITDGMTVQPGHVYVIPPSHNLTIIGGKLQLMEQPELRGFKLPIDYFFRALAQDQGDNAVCIVLSGTGTDGTLGLKAIKAELGMAMVQSGESAKYDGMPRSAIATGLADYVLAPEDMPVNLINYSRHATDKVAPRVLTDAGGSANELQKICAILRTQTGHDFSLYKTNTICRRIERRMSVHQIDSTAEYVRLLQANDGEATILFKELLIGVTNFFRDPEAFDLLADQVIPKILRGIPEDYTIRVWVPGCSTGEEAYSIAILFHEYAERSKTRNRVQVFGTDIDADAIHHARKGIYPECITVDVSPDRLKRFFLRDDDGQYRIKAAIRESLVFAPHNVIKDPPFTKLDLVCCRNLLIYLGPQLQQRLISLFRYAMKPNGILFLGSSETVGTSSGLFDMISKKWKIFRVRPASDIGPAELTFPVFRTVHRMDQTEDSTPAMKNAKDLSTLQLVETILMQSGTPPCAVIDSRSDVIYIHGRTGHFLEPAEGKFRMNLLEMARGGLKPVLSEAIRRVDLHRQPIVKKGVKVRINGDHLLVNLTVKPILEDVGRQDLKMVIFEEIQMPVPSAKAETASRPARTIEELEEELQFTRESLQSTIEELEASNEELKSSNEELQSTNEELQSANEELETSKEELQSLNEESVTVNAELQGRIEELGRAHDDIANLLNCTGIATLFLDMDARITRFTPKITSILPVTGSDVGRPVGDLSTTLTGVDLDLIARTVLRDLRTAEREVQSNDQQAYAMRVQPYRTMANVIDGVVITFENMTRLKRAEEELIARTGLLTASARVAKIGSWEWDVATKAFVWSDEMYELLGLHRELGIPPLDGLIRLVHPEDRSMVSPEAVARYAEQKSCELDFRIVVPHTNEVRHIHLWGKVKCNSDGGAVRHIGTVQDVTAFRPLELEGKRAHEQWRAMTLQSPDHVMLTDPDGTIRLLNHAIPGLAHDQATGTSIFGSVSPAHVSRMKAVFTQVLATGTNGQCVVDFLLKDGTARRFECRVGPLSAHDKAAGLIVSARDTSEFTPSKGGERQQT